jgi:hypothetical protein
MEKRRLADREAKIHREIEDIAKRANHERKIKENNH